MSDAAPAITQAERDVLRRNGILLTSLEELYNWGRSHSVWPLNFGLACCAIEMIAASMARFDIARFGSEVFRPSPRQADLLIGAVLVPGAKAPVLVSEALVKQMKRGAVIVDVAIDQGGSIATSRPTTHGAPTFIRHGVVHYCVTNMPGAVARTSTSALTNATFPYVLEIANKGWRRAAADNAAIRSGLNIVEGGVTFAKIAEQFRLPLRQP